MTLIALAAAQTLADDVDAWGMPRLRALLPMAGMTVIEQQAESARRAGAERMLLLVDGVPSALAEVCDRIRARGLPVELVRDGSDVVRTAGEASRMLLVGDAIIASATAWRSIAAARSPILLVTDDSSSTQVLERIDAETRWAGLALLDNRSLGELANCPSDWDPQLFMFRAAVQSGVDRLDWDESQFVSGDMAVATSGSAIAALEQRAMAQADVREPGLGRRWLMGPLVRLCAAPLLARQNSGKAARLVSLALAFGAGGLVMAGQLLPGVALGMVAMLAHVAGDFVARFRPEAGLWKRLAGFGLAVQIIVLVLAERGSSWGSPQQVLGDGGFTLAILAMVTEGQRLRWSHPLLDLAAIWPLYLLCIALLGPSLAIPVIAVPVMALFWLGIWQERRADTGNAV